MFRGLAEWSLKFFSLFKPTNQVNVNIVNHPPAANPIDAEPYPGKGGEPASIIILPPKPVKPASDGPPYGSPEYLTDLIKAISLNKRPNDDCTIGIGDSEDVNL